ncbi:hypothetical protein B0H63DRAFT_180202 [Podospora didyma]|uniref:SEC7 domain-containing protein n=1 Tax=Podospora didyma TaxID=330526 RepID=A0AAE0NPD7_9PEZI|nr:hypothetical protein B0H63DRAFT_180202 [Podospora didyma]
MHSSTDTARRSASRTKPELNINTNTNTNTSISAPVSRSDRERDSRDSRDSRDVLPQTPPAKSKRKPAAVTASGSGGRALRLPTTRDADMETFLESLTPVDITNSNSHNKEKERRPEPPRPNPRDSHDLSLPARQVTRDSLVTNMLLSLDQFSMGQTSNTFGAPRAGFDDPAIYSPYGTDDGRTMTFTSRTGRPNNGGHGYSYSSDLEGADDASRISSRGRRSNSSSGFQSSLGRINSMRETTSHQSITAKQLHSRGGKGSKSSSTNSIDAGYVQVLSSQRWARDFGGRSPSFEAGQPRPNPIPHSQTAQPQVQSPWQFEFSNTFFNDANYDAAPTPNVPTAPRKLATVPSMPVLLPQELRTEPKMPAMERRRSTRSSRSATVGRKADSKFLTARDAPPMPTLDLESAPAPHVGYEKTKDAGTPASGSQQTKEKPGFFRRMFGSSKPSPVVATPPAQASAMSIETPGTRSQTLTSQSRQPSAPPSRDSHYSATHTPPIHTLQKKASSFFRRRKPSITEPDPPPLPSLPALPPGKLPIERVAALAAKPEPSPITSLRRAMDPFLASPGGAEASTPTTDDPMPSIEDFPLPSPPGPTTDKSNRSQLPDPEATDDDRPRNMRGFSPGYEPSPRAVIRSVEIDPAEINMPRLDASPPVNQSPPKSFLQDNSDSEDSPQRVRKQQQAIEAKDRGLMPGLDQKRTRSPSPTVFKAKSVPNFGRGIKHADHRNSNNLGLPIEGILTDENHGGSTETIRYAPSLPSLRIDSAEPSPSGMGTTESANQSSKSIDEPDFVVGDPTEDDRQKAQKMFDGNEDFIGKEKAAAWMGEEGIVRQRTLRAFLDLFDFEDTSIVASLRQVCQRLLLRAETQQVDRILVAFTRRWCDCNPNHGFKASDIIHTICYSIILLNTDLHMADIEHKMTRSQFIKNTMTTIRHVLQDVSPGVFDRPSILPGKGLNVDGDTRTSGEHDRFNSLRASFKPPPRPTSAIGFASDHPAHDEGCGPLVKAPFEGSLRGWESQVETVLKNIYASIRDDRLPLFGSEATPVPNPGGLTVMGMLKRSPSVLSKAPSEGVASTRGRIPESAKANSSRWNSKSRSRPRGFGNGFSSSRTSFEDNNSLWSPTESSATWSRASLGRTHTSMSMDSFGSSYPRPEHQQSIGFASALSQAIIREDIANDDTPSIAGDDLKSAQLLEDESLELAGPPWIKEGIVSYHRHMDDTSKKAKSEKSWTEVFAVVQKGQLSLFSFSPNKSLRHKNRHRSNAALPKGAVVGGGNWQENATNLGTFSLQQALAYNLPPSAMSRSRPHVWGLTLHSGAVYFFQVGTSEISNEFIITANYWSARLSMHPLVGGVTNLEFGWSDAIINNALITAINDSNESNGNLPGRPGTSVSSHKGHSRPGSGATAGITAAMGRSSMQSRSSMRSSSFDFARPGSGSSGVLGGIGSSSLPRHGRLPGDMVRIAEWTPPAQSMRASTASERVQLETLANYAKTLEADLQQHNALRSPMLVSFSPRTSNAVKAMKNWQTKSNYLLNETTKYVTYVAALRAADERKQDIYREREAQDVEGKEKREKELRQAEKDSLREGDDTILPIE